MKYCLTCCACCCCCMLPSIPPTHPVHPPSSSQLQLQLQYLARQSRANHKGARGSWGATHQKVWYHTSALTSERTSSKPTSPAKSLCRWLPPCFNCCPVVSVNCRPCCCGCCCPTLLHLFTRPPSPSTQSTHPLPNDPHMMHPMGYQLSPLSEPHPNLLLALP